MIYIETRADHPFGSGGTRVKTRVNLRRENPGAPTDKTVRAKKKKQNRRQKEA